MSDNKQKQKLFSNDTLTVTAENFENDKGEKVEYVKLQTIKVKKWVPVLSYITIWSNTYKELVQVLTWLK